MNVMTLYHGSNQIIQSPHLLKIQRALDFQLCRGTKSMRKNVYFAIVYYDRHIIHGCDTELHPVKDPCDA